MFEGDEFEMGKKTKFCGSSDISGDATEEGAARKYKEREIALKTTSLSLCFYSGFVPKKPINSSKSRIIPSNFGLLL